MDPRRSVEKIQDCEAAATRLRGAGPTGEYRARLKQLAELYLAADGYEPAIGCLDELIARRDELGLRSRELVMLFVKKAEALRIKGQTREAMDCCREAEGLLGDSKSGLAYARLKMTRASVHTDMGQYAEALCHCNEALPLLRTRDAAEGSRRARVRFGADKGEDRRHTRRARTFRAKLVPLQRG